MPALLKQQRLPLALLLLTYLTFFSRTLFFGQVYFLDDLKIIYYPLEHVYAQFQANWSLPVWSELFGFGQPLLAWGQLGFFTPVHVLLRFLGLHPLLLLQASILIYFALGLAGMYWFLVKHRLHPLAAALGALVYVFSGFNVGHLNHVNFYVGTMVLPWLLLAIRHFITRPTLPSAALLALPAATIALSAHAQLALYTLIAGALYGLICLLLQTTNYKLLTKTVSLTLLAGLLSISLASLSILPLLEFLPLSDRGTSLPKEELYEFSYPPQHLITLIKPYHFGDQEEYWGAKNFQELAAYVGLIPLILAGFALLKSRRHALFYFTLTLLFLSLFIAPGKYSPVYRFLVENEILTSLAIPGRFVFFFDLGIALLSALGLNILLKRRRLAVALTILAAANLIYYGWHYNPLTPARQALSQPPIYQLLSSYRTETGLPARLLSRPALLQHQAPSEQHATDPISPRLTINQPIVVPPQASCLMLPLYGNNNSSSIKVSIGNATLNQIKQHTILGQDIDVDKDYAICSQKFESLAGQELTLTLTSEENSHINAYFHPVDDPTRQFAAGAELIYDWTYLNQTDQEKSIASRHLQATAGASSAQWISAFGLNAYREFITTHFANDRPPIDGSGQHFLATSRPTLDSTGITHLAQFIPHANEDAMTDYNFNIVATQSTENGRVVIYENQNAFPKAFLTTQQDWSQEPNIVPGIVTITRYTPSQIAINAAPTQDAILILTDAYAPQWKVLVNDQPAPILIANNVFRAVELPAGQHTITFYYASRAVTSAQKLTIIAAVVTLTLLLTPYLRRRLYDQK